MNNAQIRMLNLLAIVQLLDENTTRISNITDPLDKIDLEAEYKLIQLKKSKLSRANRDRVVYLVESKPLSNIEEVEL